MSRLVVLAPLVVALLILLPGCPADRGTYEAADPALSVPARAEPGVPIAWTVTARNAGTAAWTAADTEFQFDGDGGFTASPLRLAADVPPGQTGTFTGTATVPSVEGELSLSFTPAHDGVEFGLGIGGVLVVACDDAVFCNGIERLLSSGVCGASSPPCDDGADCTIDSCDEALAQCGHVPDGPDCSVCASDCTPDCADRACGDDGCGGDCGSCDEGFACAGVAGQCGAVDSPGSCGDPLPLLLGGVAEPGASIVVGDTTAGLAQVVPTCNATSTAVELVYSFEVIAPVGIDVRSSGYDTVLHLRKEDPSTGASECLDDAPSQTVACSDDASPPGDYGSRLAATLDAGTYFLIVDGLDATQYGPFELDVRFAADGCVPQCDGRYCGGDDGCGGDCGACPADQGCTTEGRCEPLVCEPQCDGRECGDDGCGGDCGSCAAPELCVRATGQCETFEQCDPLAPVCVGCSADSFCGVDCACHPIDAPLPDLVVSAERLATEILFEQATFSADSCAVAEECVGGTGERTLLRFSVEAVNQGLADMNVPPPDTRPDLFQFSECHGHYHYSGFATYALLDAAGATVVQGRKQAYCMEDTARVAAGPDVGCSKLYDCDNQGIQAGWSDLYGNALDCQWLDVTGVPAGEYRISVTVNPGGTLQEVTLGNNTATAPVSLP